MKFKADVDEDVIPGTKYRIAVEITSKDLKGNEWKETEYFYFRVEEKKSYGYVLALILILVLVAVAMYRKRRLKK